MSNFDSVISIKGRSGPCIPAESAQNWKSASSKEFSWTALLSSWVSETSRLQGHWPRPLQRANVGCRPSSPFWWNASSPGGTTIEFQGGTPSLPVNKKNLTKEPCRFAVLPLPRPPRGEGQMGQNGKALSLRAELLREFRVSSELEDLQLLQAWTMCSARFIYTIYYKRKPKNSPKQIVFGSESLLREICIDFGLSVICLAHNENAKHFVPVWWANTSLDLIQYWSKVALDMICLRILLCDWSSHSLPLRFEIWRSQTPLGRCHMRLFIS